MASGIALASSSETADETATRRRAIIAAIIGNTLEWYDFAVYGFLAITIGRLFFPSGDETVSLLLAVATFGVGFVMRPVGALVLGSMADRNGRKSALSLTIMLMVLGTAILAFAPTYASTGPWAPALIVLARLIQGFSAGGEIGAATAFLVEHSPDAHRGYYASWQQASQAGALLLGSLLGALLTGLLPQDALESWGWRVPFLFGLLIGPVGLYIRLRTPEPQAMARAAADRPRSPLATAFGQHRRDILTGFGITIAWTVCTYFFLIYMPTYAVRQLGISQSASLLTNSVALVFVLALAPVFGGLSDRIGRPPLLIGAAGLIVLTAYPAMWFVTHQPMSATLLVAQIWFAILIAAFTGPAPAAMAELFPPEVRSTGLSIAYTSAVTIFGGFAPFIATWLIASTGNPLSPVWYVTAAAALSLVAILGLLEAQPDGLRARNVAALTRSSKCVEQSLASTELDG